MCNAVGTKRRKIVLGVDIGDVKRAMLAHPAKSVVHQYLSRTYGNGHGTKMSPRKRNVALVESQHYVIDPANPRGAFDDGIQHRLHVRRRSADYAEHLSRCRLMLQGLAQFSVAFLDFLEQPDVLDGDNRLVGERFQQGDLLIRKRPDLGAADMNHANGLPSRISGVASAVRIPLMASCGLREFLLGFYAHIMNMDRLPFEYGSASVPSHGQSE